MIPTRQSEAHRERILGRVLWDDDPDYLGERGGCRGLAWKNKIQQRGVDRDNSRLGLRCYGRHPNCPRRRVSGIY